jgi:hypothetical protein
MQNSGLSGVARTALYPPKKELVDFNASESGMTATFAPATRTTKAKPASGGRSRPLLFREVYD